jgi:hypothetical protein
MTQYKVMIYEGTPEDGKIIKEEILDNPPKTIFVGGYFVAIKQIGETDVTSVQIMDYETRWHILRRMIEHELNENIIRNVFMNRKSGLTDVIRTMNAISNGVVDARFNKNMRTVRKETK